MTDISRQEQTAKAVEPVSEENIATAGNEVTKVGNRYVVLACDLYKNYRPAVWGLASFAVPATYIGTNFQTLNAIVPLMFGSGFFAFGVAVDQTERFRCKYDNFNHPVKYNLEALATNGMVGAMFGAVTLGIVGLLDQINDYSGFYDAVSQGFKTACWIPGQNFKVMSHGKEYVVTAADLVETTSTTMHMKDKSVTNADLYHGVFDVTHSYNDFWSGAKITKTDSFSTDERQGPFKPEEATKGCLLLKFDGQK